MRAGSHPERLHGKPNNGGGLQAYAAYDSNGAGGLEDLDNYRPKFSNGDTLTLNKAVMKCCAKGYVAKTFCTAP